MVLGIILSVKNRIITLLRWTLRLAVGAALLSVAAVIVLRFMPVYVTPLMLIRKISPPARLESAPIRYEWIDLSKMSSHLSKAFIAAEDSQFFAHNGFDFEAIQKAMKYNKTHRQKKGASTISQQTAKNVFLWPNRSWIRKGIEVYFTVLIEFLWSKERILEVYLNVIELGHGIYGVEAASREFFHKPANRLTVTEASLLAAVLPNPIKFKVNKPSLYVTTRSSRIQRRMNPAVIGVRADVSAGIKTPQREKPTMPEDPADEFDGMKDIVDDTSPELDSEASGLKNETSDESN